MKLKLKDMLLIQSLSPVAVLTLIRTISLIFDRNQNNCSESHESLVALIVALVLCVLWLAVAAFSWVTFSAFKWIDKKQGYELSYYEEKEDASINYFVTMIIPLLIDDVGTIQGVLAFIGVVVMMFLLLSKTHLFYANPVLALLDYHLYEIRFKNNEDFKDKKCLALVKVSNPKNIGTVEYKVIEDTVLYMKAIERTEPTQ